MKITKATAKVWRAKLKTPFTIASGAHAILENVLFSIELEDGSRGYGEAAVATHITGETVVKTLANLKKAAGWIQGVGIQDYKHIFLRASEELSDNKCALAALEMAVLDALTRTLRIPMWKCFGDRPQILKTDLTLVIALPAATEQAAREARKLGIKTLKIKVGRHYESDLERVRLAAKAAPGSRIILDANQGWNRDLTLQFIADLRKSKIRPVLIEQPVAKGDWNGLVAVSRSLDIPVCADESASSVADIRKLARLGFRGVINIKFVKFGIYGARRAVAEAKRLGFKLMMGVMMESPLATTAAAHFAAGIGGFDFIDLDSPYFMKEKITQGYSIGRSGVYDLRKCGAGIGVWPA